MLNNTLITPDDLGRSICTNLFKTLGMDQINYSPENDEQKTLRLDDRYNYFVEYQDAFAKGRRQLTWDDLDLLEWITESNRSRTPPLSWGPYFLGFDVPPFYGYDDEHCTRFGIGLLEYTRC